MRAIAIAAYLTLAAAGDARAEATAKAQAAAHVAAASEAHTAGRYADARTELLAAHALDPAPELLFALGQVHVKLGACATAIRLYERFIATATDDGARAAAGEAIEACRKAPAPAPPPPLERATSLHAAGKYAEALPELQLAYALDPKPDVLYAIGQVEVKLGRCPRAILYYERFLATSPPAGPAGAATEAIETCRTRPPPPATPPAKTEVVTTRAPWYTDAIGDALALGGIVLGVGAAFSYTSARSSIDAADRATTYDAHAAFVEEARDQRRLAVILAVGGVAAGTAAVVRYLRADRTRVETRVIVTPTGDGGAAVVLGGRW